MNSIARVLIYSEGDTYIADVYSYTSDGRAYTKRLIDSEGNFTPDFDSEYVYVDNIISDKILKDINPKVIYHFTSPNAGYQLKASNFVVHNTSITRTTSTGLGSGIYALFIANKKDLHLLRLNSQQKIYEILCETPLILQDEAHGLSLTAASMATNRYMDGIIEITKNNTDEIRYANILNIIRNTESITVKELSSSLSIEYTIDGLLNLWNIVFARTEIPPNVSRLWLELVLASYAWDYFSDTKLLDSRTGEILHEMPINYIMRVLGYDSLLASDSVNNSWSRGCIYFKYYNFTDIILESPNSRI